MNIKAAIPLRTALALFLGLGVMGIWFFWVKCLNRSRVVDLIDIMATAPADSARRLDAKRELSRIGPEAIPDLLVEMEAKDSRFCRLRDRFPETDDAEEEALERRLRAMRGFIELGATASNAVPSLARLVMKEPTSGPAAVALAAIRPLGFGPLFAALTNEDPNVRASATDALSSLTGSEYSGLAVERLSLVLGNDNSADVRAMAVATLALFKTHPNDVARHLIDHSRREPDESVRLSVMWALGSICSGEGEVMREIAQGLRDESPMVRISAARALSRCAQWAAPYRESLEVLAKGDPDPSVRKAASSALDALGRSALKE